MSGSVLELTAVYTAERPRLLGLAYRMLSSRAEAEDVVQDAWLRLQSTPQRPDNPAAWLTTVTTRIALDRLRSAHHRRQSYVGPWLPEPVRTDAHDTADPADLAERADTLTLGFLVLLDALPPEDRAVFLLAEVFSVPFADIAHAVQRSPEACRQAASRARKRLRSAGPPPTRPGEQAWHLAGDLAAAVASGDMARTIALLAPDVELVSDGGATRHAARRPVLGPERVARLLVNLTARTPPGATAEMVEVNGGPAVVVRVDDHAEFVVAVEVGPDDRVRRIHIVVAPDKLARLDDPPHLV